MGRTTLDHAPPVVVDRACFFALVNSAVEVYNRETTGLIVGRERRRLVRGKPRRVLVLEAAYPFQTATRSVTWVEAGNFRAAHRARNAVDSLGFRTVGEYHSHTNYELSLSHEDLAYARDALAGMNGTAPPRWLELVLGMKRKEYARPRRPGVRWRSYRRKLGCTVVLAPRLGFDVTLAGYWVRAHGARAPAEEARLHAGFPRRDTGS